MMGPERRDPFPRPAIPASGQEAIAVERARQEVIRANAGEYPNGRDQILRCLDAILPTTSSWDAYLGMAETFAPVNTVALLLEATRGAGGATTAPVVLADAGVENVNVAIGALIETGVLRRLLAFTELRFWNSMIEAWRRSLKHQWLYRRSLDSAATIRRLVFYVHEHKHVRPHSAFRGHRRPDEMYFGTGETVRRCRKS